MDVSSWFRSFCDQWGNVASVLGLLFTLIGFGVTLWGLRRIRKVTKEAEMKLGEATEAAREEMRSITEAGQRKLLAAQERIATQILVSELGNLIRLLTGILEACEAGQWVRAIDKAREAKYCVTRTLMSPRITAGEQEVLRNAPADLQLIAEYIQTKKMPDEQASKALPTAKSRSLNQVLEVVWQIQVRLQATVQEN